MLLFTDQIKFTSLWQHEANWKNEEHNKQSKPYHITKLVSPTYLLTEIPSYFEKQEEKPALVNCEKFLFLLLIVVGIIIAIGWSVGLCLLVAPVLHIWLDVEVGKEQCDDKAISQIAQAVLLWERAILGHIVGDWVSHDGKELNQLQLGQVLLPPKVLLHVWSNCWQGVVSVHDRVNKRVEHA